jgi:hypothetical protein
MDESRRRFASARFDELERESKTRANKSVIIRLVGPDVSSIGEESKVTCEAEIETASPENIELIHRIETAPDTTGQIGCDAQLFDGISSNDAACDGTNDVAIGRAIPEVSFQTKAEITAEEFVSAYTASKSIIVSSVSIHGRIAAEDIHRRFIITEEHG